MTAFERLEDFVVRIADAAAGDSRAFDRLLAENVDEARRLISEAKLPDHARYGVASGHFHYIQGIEARLPRA